MILDIDLLAKWNLHPALYRVKSYAWIKAFLTPFKYIYTTFKTYEAATDKLLRPTNETIVQKELLNDLYDSILRRISIVTEGDELPDNYIYDRDDLRADETLVLWDRGESGTTPFIYDRVDYENSYDYTVNIPAALSAQENTIRTTLERYRIASMRYRIVYI